LTRIGASGSLHRLDSLVATGQMTYAPITTAGRREAALFWADARQRGLPRASPDALDGDVILAACAATIGQPGDQIIVATQNVGHLLPGNAESMAWPNRPNRLRRRQHRSHPARWRGRRAIRSNHCDGRATRVKSPAPL
jgi:hypothetical protein